MKSVDGTTYTVVGSFTMTHKRTYKTKYFLAVEKPGTNELMAMNVSDFKGMTQKKASQMNKINRDVKLPPYIEIDFV